MTFESMLGFSAAMFVLAATPGPGVFASVSQALSSGFRSSLDVIAGIVVGDIVFLLLAVFGLSALAYVLGDLFFVIKLLGGAYLVWLGWKMWTAQPVSFDSGREAEKSGGWGRFMGGLLITLGNPKAILFYAGFLPNFIDLRTLSVSDVGIIMLLIALILTGVLGGYAYSASQARGLFTSPRASRNLNRGAGTVMIGTGIAIASR